MDPSSPTLPVDEHPDRTRRRQELFAQARRATGFMPDDEGEALFLAALRAGASFQRATFVEIGAWCGKSTVYLGAAAEETGAVLFSLDHHHGSEENQAGWEHHDNSLVDPDTGRIDTLPHWRRTIVDADLEPSVVGLVGDSPTVSSRWTTPLAFCFIDGGHGDEPAWADYRGWAPHVVPRTAGWPSTTSSPTRPTAGDRPTTSGGRPSTPVSSSRTASAARCGCCVGAEPGPAGSLQWRPGGPGARTAGLDRASPEPAR